MAPKITEILCGEGKLGPLRGGAFSPSHKINKDTALPQFTVDSYAAMP